MAFFSPDPVTMNLSSNDTSQLRTELPSATLKACKPWGFCQAFRRLSLPVVMNHFPEVAYLRERTHCSCDLSRYVSGFVMWMTSTALLSIPTASQSPVGQQPRLKICEGNSYWTNCWLARRSHERTVLSKPPVHSFNPSLDKDTNNIDEISSKLRNVRGDNHL